MSNKNKILREVYEAEKIRYVAKFLCRNNPIPDLWQELISELIISLSEKSEPQLSKIENLEKYCIGILYNFYQSTSSPFYKKHKHFYNEKEAERINAYIESQEADRLPDQTDLIQQKAIRAQNILQAKHWYQRGVFEAYIKEGSIRAVARKTKIPFKSVHQVITEIKIELQQEIKKNHYDV